MTAWILKQVYSSINDVCSDDGGSMTPRVCEYYPKSRINSLEVDHIMMLPTKEAKSEMMKLISAEFCQEAPRPTILRITLISNRQSVVADECSAYAITYDLIEDRIVIKRYGALLGHHPLGDLWFTAPDAGMASFVGRPGALVRRIVAALIAVNELIKKVVKFAHKQELHIQRSSGGAESS
ncbi:MAG: hypothetical protein M1836_003642 [Candelina mexicana]|nr:MAG: hypothetical protein M1836_003642 [Candelina mexicana]